MVAFAQRAEFRYGQAAESAIAQWLRSRGWAIMPIYEKVIDTGKGPQLYLPDDALIAPDLFAFTAQKALWIEAKHKTAFTWHRLTGQWVTGIDIRHYEHYQRVDKETPWPVWLMFWHDGGHAKDSPKESPRGLFGHKLSYLVDHEHHRSDRWGRWGMVYWAHEELLLVEHI